MMPDRGSSGDGRSAVTAVAPPKQDAVSGNALGLANNRDLLLYMGDMLDELEAMAASARLEGLADLLRLAGREAERNRKRA
jgi:hypothetical protein